MKNLVALILVTLVCFVLAWLAPAQTVPWSFSYQGRLIDTDTGLPLNQTGLAMDFALYEDNVNQQNIQNEAVMLFGSTPHSLMHQGLVPGSVTVTFGNTVFVINQDYTMDYPNGTITRVPAGNIPAGWTLWVDYGYWSAGFPIWTEAHSVDVVGGIYTVTLGESNPLNPGPFALDATLYLEVVVEGETLSPRQQLLSVPYAMNAERLQGHQAVDFAASYHTHSFNNLTDQASDAQVPDNITINLANNANLLDNLDSTAFALVSHAHNFSALTGTVSDAQVPDNITISLANNANLLDNLDSTAFALAAHAHNFSALTGTASDAQVSDNITISLANNANLLDNLDSSDFVHVAGDTITGDLRVNGRIGLGRAPSSSYGILNSSSGAPTFGALLYGADSGLQAVWTGDASNYAYLGREYQGVLAHAGSTDATGSRFGGSFKGESQSWATGVDADALAYGSDQAYGVDSFARNYNIGDAYAVYANADANGPGHAYGISGIAHISGAGYSYGVYAEGNSSSGLGTNYGIYASSQGGANNYAGYFPSGKVRVGTAGTENHVDGNGDLYVAGDQEVNGEYYYPANRTRYLSISPGAMPWDNFQEIDFYFNSPSGSAMCIGINGSCGSAMTINLPERARVTALRVWGVSDQGTHDFVCTLSRSPLTNDAYEEMARVTSTGANMNLADTSITAADIDNGTYEYMLHLEEKNSTSTLVGIWVYGIRIDYTVDGPE
jgi:hypothetical protein